MKFPPFHWLVCLSAVGTILSAFLPVTTAVTPAMNALSKGELSSLRPANFASTQIAQNSATCRQTTTRILVYEQPDTSSAIVGQAIPALNRVTLDREGTFQSNGQPRVSGWARITTPRRGYVLSRYLTTCRNADNNPPNQTPETIPIVRGCALVQPASALGASSLGIRSRIGSSPYTSVRADSRLILGDPDTGTVRNGRRDPRNIENRYWVSVLAIETNQGGRLSQAWIPETGPNAPPDLVRSSNGILYRGQTRYRNNLNIIRRSCSSVFPNSGIVENQYLPNRLPGGMQVP